MAKVDLGGDFAALSSDEFANALALVVAALRGVVVPRNALTGAIEITEGPDAVQPTATLGAIDAFWHTLYTRFLNIDGTLVSARTLLPVVPAIFTRPVSATEDQAPVTTWAWPYDLENSALVTLVSPQVGGPGGDGGTLVGANYAFPFDFIGGRFSGPYHQAKVGGYYSYSMLVSSLTRGDEFRFSFGRGGAGGAGGAVATGIPSGSSIRRGALGGSGQAPVGATGILAPGASRSWLVLPVVVAQQNAPFFNRFAEYMTPLHVSAGNFLIPSLTPNAFIQFYHLGGGDGGAQGTSVIPGQGVATSGSSGLAGSDGLIIIQPLRRST